MEKVILIDGHNLLWRAFYGFPSRILNSKKEDITAVFGFFALFRSNLNKLGYPSECLVCFDGQNSHNKRNTISPEYKLNRSGNSLEPLKYLNEVKIGLTSIGIPWIEHEDLEADDVIATICLSQSKPCSKIIIVSSDKDFYQLLSGSVSICNYRSKDLVSDDIVEKKYSVNSKQWCDYISLVGDPSDNIQGVDGIGPKKASEFLAKFISIDNFVEFKGQLTRDENKILDEITRVQKNKALIELCEVNLNQKVAFGRLNGSPPLSKDVVSELSLW